MNPFKSLLPNTLFGRGLLIVVLPVVMIQAVTAVIFFERHVGNVNKYMRQSLAGELSFVTYLMLKDPQRADGVAFLYGSQTGIKTKYQPKTTLATSLSTHDYPEFQRMLAQQIDLPFVLQRSGEHVLIDVEVAGGVLHLSTSIKRLENPTAAILLWWMLGASTLFLCIALLFLRGQVRPIQQLAEASEQFGRGQELADYKPGGALEVRRAGRAFLVMRERIRRQISARTDMLAGISHDLRTPMTRMKLQLEMMSDEVARAEFKDDLTQMEHMINEYLDFAHGDKDDETTEIHVPSLLGELVEAYRRSEHDLQLQIIEDITFNARLIAIRRLLTNLIDNAFRYGTSCCINAAQTQTGKLEIIIDDTGPGISEVERKEVFKPFTRLDAARNLNEVGVGLGLTVARDIAQNHGGSITLADAPDGGLRVLVRLPL